MIIKEVDDCLKESVQLQKHVINSLNKSFQQLNEKNFYLYADLRKINEKYLGIEKLIKKYGLDWLTITDHILMREMDE